MRKIDMSTFCWLRAMSLRAPPMGGSWHEVYKINLTKKKNIALRIVGSRFIG